MFNEFIIMRTGDRDPRWGATNKVGLSVRSWIACGGWTIILVTLLLLVVLSSEVAIQTLLILLMIYGIQGYLAELIGVKIEFVRNFVS